jgi:hypothetical protein
MRRWLLAAPSAALLTLVATTASAQPIQNVVLRNSFNPVGAGARGLGMGGAFIGVADDGSAASFNPAGLAQLRRSEAALVGFHHAVDTTVPNPDTGQTENESSSHQAPDFAGLAVPFEAGGKNLTVQLSYQRSVDLFGKGRAFTRDTVPFRELKLSLPGSARVSADIFPEQSGAFHTISAAAGYQLTSRLALGASVNYWMAGWTSEGTLTSRVNTLATPSVLVSSTNREFHHQQSLRGLSLNTGLLLRYPKLSVGAVLRLPFIGAYELKETGRSTVTETGRTPTVETIDVGMNSRLHWAQTAGVGAALRPVTGLTLVADYSKSTWSSAYLEDVPDGVLLTPSDPVVNGVDPQPSFNDRNFFDLAAASQTSTADTSELRAGAEYLVSLPKVVLPLRAGIVRSHSPIRDLSKDEGRHINGITFGSGLNFRHLVLDVAFEHRRSEGVVGLQLRRGALQPSGSSVETVKETRVVTSVIYRFGDNDPVKRLLRSLFVGGDEIAQ